MFESAEKAMKEAYNQELDKFFNIFVKFSEENQILCLFLFLLKYNNKYVSAKNTDTGLHISLLTADAVNCPLVILNKKLIAESTELVMLSLVNALKNASMDLFRVSTFKPLVEELCALQFMHD